jgi:hypothetical protein
MQFPDASGTGGAGDSGAGSDGAGTGGAGMGGAGTGGAGESRAGAARAGTGGASAVAAGSSRSLSFHRYQVCSRVIIVSYPECLTRMWILLHPELQFPDPKNSFHTLVIVICTKDP